MLDENNKYDWNDIVFSDESFFGCDIKHSQGRPFIQKNVKHSKDAIKMYVWKQKCNKFSI